MKTLLLILLSCLLFTLHAFSLVRDTTEIKILNIGTFHTKNTIYNGFSFGYKSSMLDARNVTTNGFRFEFPGLGPISFLGMGFPNAKAPFDLSEYNYSETINGVNLSGGSWCNCRYNGVTIGAVGQYGKSGRGFAFALGWNLIDEFKGVQLSLLSNVSYYFKGLQISAVNIINTGHGFQLGLFNKTKHFKGIQLGLWNINQHRSLPLINWNFKPFNRQIHNCDF